MKTDTFTKVVLSIIAINLTLLSFKNLDIVPKAYAGEPNPLHGLSYRMNYGLIPLNKEGGIDVTIRSIKPGETLDVNIQRIGGFATFGEIPIEIKDQPIEVKIKD
jgi:hypothetical protein